MRVPYSERSSEPHWPRVMAVSPRGVVASVDRDRYGLGIEPRNRIVRSADALGKVGRQHCSRRNRKRRAGSARSENPCTY